MTFNNKCFVLFYIINKKEVVIMNKIIKTTFVLGMAAFMVTGCDIIQYKQVEYDEWHEKVSNLPECPEVTKIVVKGKTDGKVIDIVIKDGEPTEALTEEESGVVIVMALASGNMLKEIKESANTKYYVGQLFKEGFKMVDEDDKGTHTLTWDKYGNLLTYKDKDLDISAKYTFKEE